MGKAPDMDPPPFTSPQQLPSVSLAGNKAPITPLAQRKIGGGESAGGGVSRMMPRSFGNPQSSPSAMSTGGDSKFNAVMDLIRGSI